MRAAAYAHIFDVLREKLGTEPAIDLLSEATRRLGASKAAGLASFAPTDLAGLKDAFLDGIPARDVMFAPAVTRCDHERLEIQFHRCPLKEAWQAMGRSDTDLTLLCAWASVIDSGLFEAAGFTFSGEPWRPGQTGCCLLRIEPRAARC